MLAVSLAFAAFGAVSAHQLLESNLAYRSPSHQVRSLGVDIKDLFKRNERLGKRWDSVYDGNITYPYGVASGDPYNTSVILWAMPRKYDDQGLYGGNSYPPICLHYKVSETSGKYGKESLAADGQVTTTIDIGFSVKAEATGLKPNTKYFYRFENCANGNYTSPEGSFKTLPNAGDDLSSYRIAVYSCSNLPFGFFNAYGYAANETTNPVDLFVHVGDYIYEYKNGDYGDGTAIGRVPQPDREISSLQDYRDRHAQYRTDPDLQKLHQKVPFVGVWDDHEVADQAYAAGTADSNNTEQGAVGGYEFSQRKANAVRAYFEWLPIRQVDTDDSLRIWRNFKVGNLADVIMLDTRNYDRDITDLYWNTDAIRQSAESANRSMTGEKQKGWFLNTLSESQDRGAKWRLVMQQTVFNNVSYKAVGSGDYDYDFDDWEGYRYERAQILKYIRDNKINNTVILSGDSHASWVFDTTYENQTNYNPATGENALGVEFAGSAVSSPSSYGHPLPDSAYIAIAKNLSQSNPGLQYAEGQLRGYFELTVTNSNCTADYYGFYDQLSRNTNATHMGQFSTQFNSNRLTRPLNGGKAPAFGHIRQN